MKVDFKILLFASLLCANISCVKHDVKNDFENNTRLYGSWKYTSVVIECCPGQDITHLFQNRIISFYADEKFDSIDTLNGITITGTWHQYSGTCDMDDSTTDDYNYIELKYKSIFNGLDTVEIFSDVSITSSRNFSFYQYEGNLTTKYWMDKE